MAKVTREQKNTNLIKLKSEFGVSLDKEKSRLLFESIYEESRQYVISEFRIRGFNVECRVVEESTVSLKQGTPDRNGHHNIRDGIVQEDEILRSVKNQELARSLIESTRNRTLWKPLEGNLRYFVLHSHPELIDRERFYRFISSEIVRIRDGAEKVHEALRKLGVTITENQRETAIEFPKDADKKIE